MDDLSGIYGASDLELLHMMQWFEGFEDSGVDDG